MICEFLKEMFMMCCGKTSSINFSRSMSSAIKVYSDCIIQIGLCYLSLIFEPLTSRSFKVLLEGPSAKTLTGDYLIEKAPKKLDMFFLFYTILIFK